MEKIAASIGRIAVSKTGRDKGRCFIIVDVIDDRYVLLADGALRKLSRPKKKKLLHLSLKPQQDKDLAQRLEQAKPVTDYDIRNAIESFGFSSKRVSEEDSACLSRTSLK